jgi:hypothetical protein
VTVAIELTELRVESRERLNGIVSKADPFQSRAWSWHRPYFTGEVHDDIETAFAVTFGYEACPAARLA